MKKLKFNACVVNTLKTYKLKTNKIFANINLPSNTYLQSMKILFEFRNTIENIGKILELSQDINLTETRLNN